MLIGVARGGWVWLRRPICQEPEDVLMVMCLRHSVLVELKLGWTSH